MLKHQHIEVLLKTLGQINPKCETKMKENRHGSSDARFFQTVRNHSKNEGEKRHDSKDLVMSGTKYTKHLPEGTHSLFFSPERLVLLI